MQRQRNRRVPGLASAFPLTVVLLQGLAGSASAQPTGACCVPASQGLCQVVTAAECAALGGSYVGDGTSCSGAAPFSGFSLSFDGVDDGVLVGNRPTLNLASGFTIEGWIYPDTLTSPRRLVGKGRAGVEGYGFGVTTSGRLRFTTFGIQDYDSLGIYVPTARWTHIAVVFDANFSAIYYVNGQFVETVVGSQPARPTAQPFYIGRNSLAPGLDVHDGLLDEVRVWNIERSAAEIAASFALQLAGNEPGLVGCWRLDEGTGSTTADQTANDNDGTIVGPTWVQTVQCGDAPSGACCLPDGSCNFVIRTVCENAGGAYHGDGVTCAAVTCPQPGACCAPATGVCRVRSDADCAASGGAYLGAQTECAIFDGALLRFDGENDSVVVNTTGALDLLVGFTLEAWVNPIDQAGPRRVIARGPAGGWGFAVRFGRLRFTTFGYQDYDTANAYITSGQWSHIAVVYDTSGNAHFYVNGQFAETVFGFSIPDFTFEPLTIGRNATGALLDYWSGLLDEVRVWNVERSAAEIADNFHRSLTGTEAGLVGYWRFNEGAGGFTEDATANNHDGTLDGPAWRVARACSSAIGACCLPSGSCLAVSRGFCAEIGGAYSGDGTGCSPNNCSQPGACCLPGGFCVGLPQPHCLAQGGTYQGAGASCGTVSYSAAECQDAFEDITATGTLATGCDDCGITVPLGFPFGFFGGPQTEIGISSNGYLTFGDDLTEFDNDPNLPSPAGPDGVIAPLWDDWLTNSGGTLHYETRGSGSNQRFIAQWTQVEAFPAGSGIRATFQAILRSGGGIDFRYGAILLNSPTVGVESLDGTSGLSIDPFSLSSDSCRRLTGTPVDSPCISDCPADLEGDGTVDLGDLTILLSHFGTPSGAPPEDGDLNGDGDVDLGDLTSFLSAFGMVCP